jgi:hypothetical protein
MGPQMRIEPFGAGRNQLHLLSAVATPSDVVLGEDYHVAAARAATLAVAWAGAGTFAVCGRTKKKRRKRQLSVRTNQAQTLCTGPNATPNMGSILR